MLVWCTRLCSCGNVHTEGRNQLASTMEAPQRRRFTANSKSSNFCLTIHHYDEYQRAGHDIWYTLSHIPKCTYVIAGRETAPATGAKHLQCYIQFEHRKKLSAVVNLLKSDVEGIHCHVEPAMGSSKDNVTYCSKEDPEPWTWGELNEVRVNDTITECVPESAIAYRDIPSAATVLCNLKGDTHLETVKRNLLIDFYEAVDFVEMYHKRGYTNIHPIVF